MSQRTRTTSPNRPALCVFLARDDGAAARLLDRVVHWTPYGKATIVGIEGEWIANDRAWWMFETALSRNKLDRAFAKLVKLGLVERHQAKFAGGAPILHVRPTAFTLDFLKAAKTWSAASELLALEKIPMLEALAQLPSVDPPLVKMLEAWSWEATAGDIGKLAVLREDIKEAQITTNGHTYTDFTGSLIPLLAWAGKNWEPKPGKKKSLATFCEGVYADVLKEGMKVHGDCIVFAPEVSHP